MKSFREMIMENYIGFVLDNTQRQKLLNTFKPKYSKVIAHHITYKFGVKKDTSLPNLKHAYVVGYIDSGDGLEALVCEVDGSTIRPDGSIFHITWSLDPTKYKPVDSNKLLQKKKWSRINKPILIKGKIQLL